jgi:hypothetical protein
VLRSFLKKKKRKKKKFIAIDGDLSKPVFGVIICAVPNSTCTFVFFQLCWS